MTICPLATAAATKRPSGETGDSARLLPLPSRRSSGLPTIRAGPPSKLSTLATLRPLGSFATTRPGPRPASSAPQRHGRRGSSIRSLPAAVGSATSLPPRSASAHFPSRESSCGFPSPRRTGAEPSIDRRKTAEPFVSRSESIREKSLLPVGRQVYRDRLLEPGEVALRRFARSPGADEVAYVDLRHQRRPVGCHVVQLERTGGGEEGPSRPPWSTA